MSVGGVSGIEMVGVDSSGRDVGSSGVDVGKSGRAVGSSEGAVGNSEGAVGNSEGAVGKAGVIVEISVIEIVDNSGRLVEILDSGSDIGILDIVDNSGRLVGNELDIGVLRVLGRFGTSVEILEIGFGTAVGGGKVGGVPAENPSLFVTGGRFVDAVAKKRKQFQTSLLSTQNHIPL